MFSCKRDKSIFILVIISYFLIVLTFMAYYGFRTGLAYETLFVYNSENHLGVESFFYNDPLRYFDSLFYHLSYLVSFVLGMRGSYIGYALVYLGLWCGRGILSYSIIKTLIPYKPIWAYLIGIITIAHGSDLTLNFYGQLNQLGYIFFTLASFFLLIQSLQSTKNKCKSAIWLAISIFACYLSLYSYMAQIFIVLLFPVGLILLFFHPTSQNKLKIAVYYIVPFIYIFQSIQYYLLPSSTGGVYETGILAHQTVIEILQAWLQQIKFTYSFWEWQTPFSISDINPILMIMMLSSAIIFTVSFVLVNKINNNVVEVESNNETNILLRLLIFGIIYTIFSFPAYIITTYSFSAWRTQFLSGFGVSITINACLFLLLEIVNLKIHLKNLIVFIITIIILFFGARASEISGRNHFQYWENYRRIMSQIISQAPSLIVDDAVFVLTNDPTSLFGHPGWFDLAIRLAYPFSSTVGIYYTEDNPGKPGYLNLNGDSWIPDGTSWLPFKKKKIPAQNTLIFEYINGNVKLLKTIPKYLNFNIKYNPCRLIVDKFSPIAVNRYRPIPKETYSVCREK